MAKGRMKPARQLGYCPRLALTGHWIRVIGPRGPYADAESVEAGRGLPWASRAVAGSWPEGRGLRATEARGVAVRVARAGVLPGRYSIHVLRRWGPVQLGLHHGQGEHQPSPRCRVPGRIHPPGPAGQGATGAAARDMGRASFAAEPGNGWRGAVGPRVCRSTARRALCPVNRNPLPTATLFPASN